MGTSHGQMKIALLLQTERQTDFLYFRSRTKSQPFEPDLLSPWSTKMLEATIRLDRPGPWA